MIIRQVGYDPTRSRKFDKWHERISLNFQSAPKGFFHAFNEAHTVIYKLIVAGADIGENVVDISIGQPGRNTDATTSLRRSTASARSIRTTVPIAIRNLSQTHKSRGVTR